MKISAAKNIVVLKPTKLENVGGGIIEAYQEKKPEIGEVCVVGEPRKPRDLPCAMKPGDVIAYRQYGESKFLIGSDEYIFVSFDDVLGIIKN